MSRVVFHPYVTEKTMNMMENENKLEFVVMRRAKKSEVKKEIEEVFEVKVESVNTRIRADGKHAVVKLGKGYSAEELGMRIGVF